MIKAAQWNPLQKELRQALGSPDPSANALKLCMEMHKKLHSREVSGTAESYGEQIWESLGSDPLAYSDSQRGSIAWDLWHITRIEDLVSSILLSHGRPVLNPEMQQKLGTTIKDTGNAMSDKEIRVFSRQIDLKGLKAYRDAVGLQTSEILSLLNPEDLKRKPSREQLDRIKAEGGVTEHPDSCWLLDFWGKKNLSGLLLMPITRHQVVHLNHAFKLKSYLKKHPDGLR